MPDNIPTMQRRHFEFIAECIYRLDVPTEEDRRRIAAQFAGRLSMTNGQFNKDKFIEAATKQED